MASPHQFRLTPSTGISTTAPLTLTQELAIALQGGTPVYDFMSGDSQALQTIYETIATSDDTIWIDGLDNNGNPVKYVAIGNNFLTIFVGIDNPSVLQDGTSGPNDYGQAGAGVVTFTTDYGTQTLTIHRIEYSGEGVGGLLSAPLITQILKFAVTSLKNYFKGLAKGAYEAPGDQSGYDADNETDTIDTSAADGAGTEGADLGGGILADFSVSASVGIAGGVGIFILLFFVFLQVMGKQMNNYVKFYNVTAEDIPFGICTLNEGESSKGPAQVGQTEIVPAVGLPPSQGGVTPTEDAIFYAQMAFNNSNPLTQIGYVLEATPSGDFPGFRVAVVIRQVFDNMLYIEFTNDNCNDVWTQFMPSAGGKPGNGSTNLTMTATSGKYTLQIATNQNSGQSPSTIDGTEGYNFEHLIVLTDGSIPLS